MAENKLKTEEKKGFNLQNPKHRSYLYTGLFFAAVIFFFIINNTNGEPEEGPYPPNYNTVNASELVNLSDFRGKVVIIDFWATWCPPCRKGIPDLVELKKEFKGKDVEIIGISLDSFTRGGATKDDVVPFIKDYGINYPIVLGDPNVTQQYGGINSIPTSFVVDKEGYIIAGYPGLVPKEQYVKDINKALSQDYVSDKKYIAPEFSLPKAK
ncbi:MAG: TlpA family protein disulfide reductase [Ignavibacteriae bacterium]|nr:TlpA family protein disulfide reductase [Ignavibacteriota bacterium]MCB9207751.1 TlpA family protein disulfide reductase [Ignavibacteriales bacterium]MCB9258521.1 TlpA family protein disulfide reductase [Ignavibacteriales bacterium]